MLLYIIRHGDPNYASDSLTERGVLQAEALGKRLAAAGINRVYSSPTGRARMTAEPTCRRLGLECHIEEWAHEIGGERMTPFPDGKRKSITDVQNTYLLENGYRDLPYTRGYECQGMNQTQMKQAVSYIEENGKAFLERLGYREENGIYHILRKNEDKVALFCHAAMSRAWLSVLLHVPIHIMWAGFRYTHTGVTVLEFKNNENMVTAPTCLCYSDMSHLLAEGLDMRHDNAFEI